MCNTMVPHGSRHLDERYVPLGQQIWNDTLAGPSPKKWVNVKALKSGENISFVVFLLYTVYLFYSYMQHLIIYLNV